MGKKLDTFMQLLGLAFAAALVGAAASGLFKVEHISDDEGER